MGSEFHGPKDEFQVEFVNGTKFFVIENIFINARVFEWQHKCDFQCCPERNMCCQDGAWITSAERARIEPEIEAIAGYLLDIPGHPFGTGDYKFAESEPIDGYYHTFVHGNRCIFQQEDGGCAIHSHGLATPRLYWNTFKFEICTTFPIIITRDEHRVIIDLLEYHDWFAERFSCLERVEFPGNNGTGHTRKPLLEVCREEICTRLGEFTYDIILSAYNNLVKIYSEPLP